MSSEPSSEDTPAATGALVPMALAGHDYHAQIASFISGLASVGAMLFVVLDLFTGLYWTGLVNFGGGVCYGLAFLLGRRGHHHLTRHMLLITLTLHIALVSHLILGTAFGAHFFLLAVAVSPALLFTGGEFAWKVGYGISILSTFLAVYFHVWEVVPLEPAPTSVALFFEIACITITTLLIFMILAFYQVAVERFGSESQRLRVKAEAQAKELHQLNVQKTSFFQNVSHELRTPLTLILNPLEEEAKAAPENKNIDVAAKNSRRLLRLVNQLLDFQKLDAGKKHLDLKPLNLNRFAYVCADYFASACSTKGVGFSVSRDGRLLEPHASPVWMMGEVDGLEKVTFNYLSNALKYTPSEGTIELGLQTTSSRVRLFVRDTGPGIAQDNQDKLFQVFSQIDQSATRAYEGTGLGLALVKSLTSEMNGEVGVESIPGNGSTFWAEFPLCSAPEDQKRLEFEVKGWLLASERGETGLEDSGTFDLAEIDGDADGELVLVVDDLHDMRDLIAASLQKRGYRVAKAANGKRGLEVATRLQPDLIITDWMMPQMSGPELVKALKGHEALRSTPVILLTAKSDEESKLIGTDIGADAFLGKPFNDHELCSLVRNLLSLKHREREVEALNHQLTENVLKRYLPPDLVEQIVAGEASLNQEPKSITATILFSDLEGFTQLSGKLRAKKLARVLNEYLSSMTEVIFEHGGTVDKFIGDAVMVVFGAPTPLMTDQQATRAATCARAMQEKLHALNLAWSEQGIPALKMRIGIHQGPVVVGTFGSEKRSDYTAIGPAVNMAARIEAVCPAGSVLVSGEICDFLEEDAAEEAGEYELKGVVGKQFLYRLVV